VTATSSETILESLREIMIDVFDLDDLVLTPATTADDIEEWDSLSHVRLVVAVERKFGFKFTNSEIESLKTVGDLVNLIRTKPA
jgi:acyl carrier protein